MIERMKLKEGLSYEVVVRDRHGRVLQRIAAIDPPPEEERRLLRPGREE